MDTIEFLDLVLPTEGDGLRCAFVLPAKRNHFFATNTELATFLLNVDGGGYTAYHACSTYGDDQSRRADNVVSVAALWADIDVGEDKPHLTLEIALQASADAASRTRLPPPLYVCSGRGLHLYWPLRQPLNRAQWRRYASGLRAAFKRVGFEVDPTRTCDAASILRTPGTVNRKDGGAYPVYVIPGGATDPYDNQLFDHLLEGQPHEDPTPQHHGRLGAAPAYLLRPTPAYLHVLSTYVGMPRPADAELVAQRCGQLARFKDWRIHKALPEPSWYALLGVLAFADNGDEAAHAWSAGHTAYQYEQTQERLDRLRDKLSGATTCEKLHSLEPKICEACPHWGKIKSPIVLGYSQDQKSGLSASTAVSTGQAPNAGSTVQIGPQGVTLPELPKGFAWHNGSLTFATETPGGLSHLIISQYSLFLQGVHEGETRGDFTLSFMQFLPNKGWFKISIATKVLLGQNGVAEMAARGANIHDPIKFLLYVRLAIDAKHFNNAMEKSYEQYGWKAQETAFLYGAKLYTAAGTTDAAVSHELSVRNQWIGPGCNIKGSPEAFGLERWKQSVNALFATGCEAQSVALLASFAAALMRFTGTDEGGAIISLVTRASGVGKTVALAGASSVWGDRKGLSLTNEDNRVTKWLTLGALGNLPLVYDELQTRDPIALRDFVINFTNGRDKMRATREGQIRHSTSTWQTLLITASNSSLVDSLSQSSQSDAPAFRVLELPLSVPKDLAYQMGDKLKNELIANAGYAGEVYAEYLAQPAAVAFIRDAVPEAIEKIYAKTGCKNEHRFWVRAAACITVASLIVKELELVEFSSDRIVQWLLNQITPKDSPAYRQTREWPAEAIAEFMLLEAANFLVLPTQWRPGAGLMRPLREPRDMIAGTYIVADKKLFANANKMKTFALEHEIPFRDWVQVLQQAGAVSEFAPRNLCAGTDIPSAPTRTLEIDMTHPLLAGIDRGLAVQPGDDTTHVVPLRRK